MKPLRVAFLGLAACLTIALPAALAADLGGDRTYNGMKGGPYAAPSAFSWTGFYVGTHLAYGWSDVDWEGVSSSLSGSGWLAGAQVGYNWQKDAFVFGLEADASSSWVDGSGHGVNWLTSVRGRLGLAINNSRTLLYGTAGVAWADIDYSAFGSDFSNTHFGWVAGGGIEHMLTQNLSARVEYLYYGFDDATVPTGALAGSHIDPSAQTVRFGLNLKF
jgi:outer membrane immunogenic protein